jgi:hypothetical protein
MRYGSPHCCDSITVKIYRFKSNRTPMGLIGPAGAPTPITTTNHSGATTSTYEYEWQIIPQVRIHWLIESLSRRVQTVLQINGGLNRCWICRCCYTISPLFDDVDVSEQRQNKVVWNVYHAHENDCVLCPYILRRPGMLEGVWDAVTVMCPGWNTRM